MDIIALHLLAAAFVALNWYGHRSNPEPRLAFLGKVWDGIKSVGKGLAGAAGKLAPVAAFIPGVGPVASAAMAGLGALAGGGGGQAGGQFGGGVPGAAMAGTQAYLQKQAMEQAQADAERARALTDQSMDWAGQERERAINEWNMGSQLRDAFRSQAMQFHDPTNPFSHGPLQMVAPQVPPQAPVQPVLPTPEMGHRRRGDPRIGGTPISLPDPRGGRPSMLDLPVNRPNDRGLDLEAAGMIPMGGDFQRQLAAYDGPGAGPMGQAASALKYYESPLDMRRMAT
jgi:hypothetical protein